MAPNPSRSTAAGRVFNDLRNMARREGRPTDELMVLYVHERFLYRMSLSPYQDKLVLKGGLLLAILDKQTFPLLGYPIETVLAEKVTTMLSLGDLNTRDRDWADVWRLTGIHELSGSRIEAALSETATYRAIRMRPLSEVISRLPRLRQTSYADWRRRQSVEAGAYPESFATASGCR
jgi:Nucleotidyl transferase AbiEii toxin, Type IV TA system